MAEAGAAAVVSMTTAASGSASAVTTATASSDSAASTAAYGFRGCLYVAAYSMWTRSEGGEPAADGDAGHVGWVRELSSETEPWVSGLYLNEVRCWWWGGKAEAHSEW